jgi:ABC-type branched-subunit amino acid transport system permease subunit
VGYISSLLVGATPVVSPDLVFSRHARTQFNYRRNWPLRYLILVIYFVVMLAFLAWLNTSPWGTAL